MTTWWLFVFILFSLIAIIRLILLFTNHKLNQVATCIAGGINEPRLIAAETGMNIKQVNALIQHLEKKGWVEKNKPKTATKTVFRGR